MASDSGGTPSRGFLSLILGNEWIMPGLLFVGFGALGLFVSRTYDMGDVNHMGPGWFPRALCIGLVVLGSILCVQGVRHPDAVGNTDGRVARGFTMILLAMIAFGFAIERLGFVLALAVAIYVASLARRDQKFLEVIATMVVIIIASVLVFVYALKLPFRLWPDPAIVALISSYFSGT